MKNIKYIIPCVLGMALLASCQEEEKITINPAAEDGTLTFVLNEPAYDDYVYVLRSADADSVMETLTVRMQPDFGFTAATTYYAQVSFSEQFTEGSYQELSTSGAAQKIAINTREMNEAITLLQGENVDENPGIMDIYVRLRAFLTSSTTTANGDTPHVSPCYSNVIKLRVQPYYMLLEDMLPQPHYIIGYIDWANDANAQGTTLIPLSLVENYSYDEITGYGEFTYTGWFEAGVGFKLINIVGGWDEQWGSSDGTINGLVHNDGGSGNIAVEESGYYTITTNSLTGQESCTIEKADVTPASYDFIELVGSFENWGENPIRMDAFNMTNPHIWTTTVTFDADCEAKFRANGEWAVSWGGDSFPYSTIKSGNNILVKAGTYTVVLNDIDGNYYFFAKE